MAAAACCIGLVGVGGSPLVFQASGTWLLQVYPKAVAYTRGSSFARFKVAQIAGCCSLLPES